MNTPNDGGPAFPLQASEYGGHGSEPGMSLRDYFAIHAPEPSTEAIATQRQYDRNRNPHNDGPPKPPIRGDEEIRCDLRYRFADAMLRARGRS
jgi:hypothetical protein